MSTLIRDYERFAKEANEICKGRVYTDHLRRYAYGVDASCTIVKLVQILQRLLQH